MRPWPLGALPAYKGVHRWFPEVVPGWPGIGACRYRPRILVTAAAGMTVLLPGAAITHRRPIAAGNEMAPALPAPAITTAYLGVALTSSA